MGERPVSYFETLQGDDVRGASCTVRLNIEKAMELKRLFRLKSLVGHIRYAVEFCANVET